MDSYRFQNDALGVDFEFKVPPGSQPTKRDVFDIIKTQVPPSNFIKLWDRKNPDNSNNKLVLDALDSGYFEDEGDMELIDLVKDMAKGVVQGGVDIAKINSANSSYNEILKDIGVARMGQTLPKAGFANGRKDVPEDEELGMFEQTFEFFTNPSSGRKNELVYAKQGEQFEFGTLPKADRQKIDKTALKFFDFYRKNPDGINTKRAKGFAGQMMMMEGLDQSDPKLLNEVLRRAGELGRLQEDVNFYKGIDEWAGGYSMLSNMFSKWVNQGESGVQFDKGMTENDKQIELDYIKENFRISESMEDGASNVARLVGDKQAEVALANELIKPDPDMAMVYSFAPDIPVEVLTMGTSALSQAGVTGVRRFVMKGQMEVLQEELLVANKAVMKNQDKLRTLEGLNNVEGITQSQKTAIAKETEGIKKALDGSIKVAEQAGQKVLEVTNDYAKPGFLQAGIGSATKGTGATLDLLGRTFEYVRKAPKELMVDAIMKVGKVSDPAEANRILNGILGLGATGAVGYVAGSDSFDVDTSNILKGIALLLGPEILQKTGTTLRHLGEHWVANNASKNTFETFQQLNSKNPKFSEIIIDRTEGASYSKTLGAMGNIFKRGDTGELMGKQGISKFERSVARFAVDTGLDKVGSFVARTGLSATTGSAVPVAFGYGMDGAEGGASALGASLPFIGLGVATGELMRHGSVAIGRVKQRGDVSNHKKNLSDDQGKLYDRLSFENQAGLANAQMSFPDAQYVIVDKPLNESGWNGRHTLADGQSKIEININADQPLVQVLAHEIGHHIKSHGLSPLIHEIMFGSVEKNKPGIFTGVGKDGWLTEDYNGVKRYGTSDHFSKLREQYLKRLEGASGIDETTRDAYSKNREWIADEVFAEYVADHILTQKPKDTQGKLMRSLFHAMSGKPFLKKAGLNMGLFTDVEGTKLFSGLKESKELNGIIKDYEKDSKRLSPEEIAEKYPIEQAGEADNDLIITPAEQIANPELMEIFNTGGIFQTDAEGNIVYGMGGKPKLMTKSQVDKVQGQMANDVIDAIKNQDDLPTGHVVMNDNDSGEGFFLSDAVIDSLQGYNASQINFLRQISNIGRRMSNGEVPVGGHGNQAIMFYYSAMKHGGKFYRSLRGGYRNMYLYGLAVSKDGNIFVRTISLDALDKNITSLMKGKNRLAEITQAFGGNSIAETRRNISRLYDTYHSNQGKGIKNGDDGSGISEAQRDWLNAFMGYTGSGSVERNPVLTKLGKKKAEEMSVIRSRRIDRIGTIEFPGGGQDIRIRKIIDNQLPTKDQRFMPQLEMDFDGTKTENLKSETTEPTQVRSWWRTFGISPKDPDRISKIADVLISPGNRYLDGDIAMNNHEAFGFTESQLRDALDKAHNRDEYKNARFRKYLPANLGLKDNIVDQVLPAINQEKFSGEQFTSAIGKIAGAKAYADDIGLTGFLEGKKSVTKTDIEDFVAENHLKLDSYDLADPRATQSIDELLRLHAEGYPTSEQIINGGPEVEAKVMSMDNQFNRNNRNLRLVADDVAFQTRVNTIQDLIDFKEMGHTEVTSERSNQTKYNRSSLVTPGERTNYNETLVEFEGGGRFEVPESSTLQYEGVIEFADPDLIEKFMEDMSMEGHEGLNYGAEYKEDLMDSVEVVVFKGNAEEYKIIKEIAERYNVDINSGESIVDLPGGNPTFKNAHWPSDKVLGHIRRTDRTIDGKDTRFLEEMQSDWLQALRRWKKWENMTPEQRTKFLEKNDRPTPVSEVAFEKNWPALLLKKAMMDAINDGKTHIAWADGKVHNDRYELSRTLDDITMEPHGNTVGSRTLHLRTKEQGDIELLVDGKGKVQWASVDDFKDKALSEVIGKQMADKILEEPSWDHKHENFRKTIKYEGKELDMSDPALLNFYDKEVVKVATKLAKKLGVGKPEKVELYNVGNEIVSAKNPEVRKNDGAWMMELPTKQALGEQTLYMPTLGDEAPKGPSSPPEVVQSNSMARQIKYKGIPAQEISNRIAQVSTELLEYGSDANPQVESTRGSLYQAKRNGIIRELNELNEVEAGLLNQGDRFMPATGQTRTKEFKNWFKDSKVVDEDGKPLVVYHADTESVIKEFSPSVELHKKYYQKILPNIRSDAEFKRFYKKDHTSEEWANLVEEAYEKGMGLQDEFWFSSKPETEGYGDVVTPVYLSIKNPKILENEAGGYGTYVENIDLLSDKDGVIIENATGEDGLKYYVVKDPTQIKSATGNKGTFDPGNPDIRFMPLLNLPGDKSVQYKKNKNIIDVAFKDATGLQDKFVTMVEADRHDTDGVRMGGPLHAFLKSNDVIVTIDGVDFRPQWANLKWSTIKGMIERVKLTDDGHALIQIMEKETHRSNKDMFSRVLGSFQDNRKNMSVLEREVTANILRILRKRFTKSKPNAQENAFLKDMTQYKTKLTRGNVDEANKILANIKKDYGKTDWWNDKEVKSFARDFTKAFTDSSFKARAEITSYFLPRDENSARMPFVPDIRKLLKSEMDYHGAKAGDVVGVVQLSKHNLNNKKRVFGVYFGKDPAEFAKMTDNEKLARKKLLANKKFRAHPSYDWLMLGPGDADFFMFDKPKNAVQMAPDFAKTHAKLWKQDVARLKGETTEKYGTTKQDPEDFSVTPDIKQRTERFKGIDKFLKESSKKPLYDQSESNIQGAMLRGHKRGVPQLTQFLK